jgi:hypothetical protein
MPSVGGTVNTEHVEAITRIVCTDCEQLVHGQFVFNKSKQVLEANLAPFHGL